MRPNLSPTALLALFSAALLSACGGSSGGSGTPQAGSGYVTFQSADLVLGQADFTSNAADRGGTTAGDTLDQPDQVALLDRGLVIADSNNNRVLGWTNVPTVNGDDADWVIGQPNFSQTSAGTGIGNLLVPSGLAYDGTTIWIADNQSNRVVGFTPVPTQTGVPAAIVLGQATFQASAQPNPPAANTMAQPRGLSATAGVLAVADTVNNRVLLFTPVPGANTSPAQFVLGQPNMAANLVNQGATPTASTMGIPYGVWTDGTRVAVADLGNNRVLLWNTFPTADGQAADLVLGQTSMFTLTGGGGPSGLRAPSDVTSDGTRLFVGDCENNRVLIWNAWPTTNGQPADVVLGQSDFARTAPNDDDQDGTADATCSARTFFTSGGYLWVHAGGGRLWVGDRRNHRVLAFTPY